MRWFNNQSHINHNLTGQEILWQREFGKRLQLLNIDINSGDFIGVYEDKRFGKIDYLPKK